MYNAAKGKRERIGRLLRMHANKREDVKEVTCGNIAAAAGLRVTTTGDTLCDEKAPVVLEVMDFPAPVISIAIEPKTQANQDKLGHGARRSWPSRTRRSACKTDAETGQTIISGMGELHLEIIVDRLVREFKIEAYVGRPQVAYRETIAREADAEGKYIRQTGGRGQYGHVTLHVGAGRGQGDRVRGRHRRWRGPARVRAGGRARRARVAGARRHGRLPGHRRRREADRRQLPRARLERDGVPDRRLDGRHGGGARGGPGPARAASWRSRC